MSSMTDLTFVGTDVRVYAVVTRKLAVRVPVIRMPGSCVRPPSVAVGASSVRTCQTDRPTDRSWSKIPSPAPDP